MGGTSPPRRSPPCPPTSAPTSPGSAPTPPTCWGSNRRPSIPPWTRSTSPSWTWRPETVGRSSVHFVVGGGATALGIVLGAPQMHHRGRGDVLGGLDRKSTR